jgi:hypothetical protein
MSGKLLAGVAVIATGVGLAPVMSGVAAVHASPSNPLSPCSNCLPGPGGGPGGGALDGQYPYGYPGIHVPSRSVIIPPVGGGPKSGGRTVQLPAAPAPGP